MTRTIVITAALALAVTLPALTAQAQSPRTFVSAAGNDSNPCSFAAPCRHFQAAVNATSAGGEVDALDPAGYGPIIISRAITIEGQGWSYIAPPINSPAITINAVTGKVIIRGVSLNGVGIAGTTTGIRFNSGGALTVRDSAIQNFSGDGILFGPNSSSQIFVSNTSVSNNGGQGINIGPTLSGSGTTTGVLNHVEMESNGIYGLLVSNFLTNVVVSITVSDSVCAGNTIDGVHAFSSGPMVSVMVRNSTITNNLGSALSANNGLAQIWATRSTITGNGSGWGGIVSTFGDNDIFGNGLANNAPTSVSHE